MMVPRPYRAPPRPIGLSPLQLPDLHLNTTAFLCVEEHQPGGAVVVPRATAFFVTDREIDPPWPIWVVTARHNIPHARFQGRQMFLRVNQGDSFVDVPTSPDDWFEDDKHDVAVAYWAGTVPEASITSVPLDQFIGEDYRYYGTKDLPNPPLRELGGQAVRVGHEVFFVGLFSQHAGTAKNLPIARFGTIARVPAEPVSVRRPDGSSEALHGYLVEASSWGGHSGSPVFWYFPAEQIHFVPDPRSPPPTPAKGSANRAARRKGLRPQVPLSHEMGLISLLGLVSAHFDIPQTAEVEGDVLGRVVTRLNAGIAVVTPAHVIRALIEREDVVAERDRYREAAGEEEPVATFDYVAAEEEASDSDFERFQDLTRRLVNTPKSEADEKQREEKG